MTRGYLTLIALAAALAGCGKPLTNEQIINETRKCEDAGMTARIMENSWNNEIMRIDCFPKQVQP